MIREIYELQVACQTHKIGSSADRNDYTNVFKFAPIRLETDADSNKLLYWNWDKFVQVREEIKSILLNTVDGLLRVFNSAGFEVKDLHPLLSSILQNAVNASVQREFRGLTIERNVEFKDTKITVSRTPYSYHGIGDVSVVITDGGVRVVLTGLEAKRGGKFFITPVKQEFSTDAFRACAQSASQMLGYTAAYERVYGACQVFLQVVSNGREWILTCSRRAGYYERHYSHTEPVSLFTLDATGKKATALPQSDHAYTKVAHMLALMMDCTCFLLNGRSIETIGAEMSKVFLKKHEDDKSGEGEEEGEGEGEGSAGRAPPPSQAGAQKASARKEGNEKEGKSNSVSSSSYAQHCWYGLTEKNMLIHDVHYGLPRGGQRVF